MECIIIRLQETNIKVASLIIKTTIRFNFPFLEILGCSPFDLMASSLIQHCTAYKLGHEKIQPNLSDSEN